MDCTKVIPTICFPVFASFLNRISLPIITPARHSKTFTVILYHCASMISAVTTCTRYGPNTTPVTSQPRMAGSLTLAASFPTTVAIQMIANTLNT